MMMMNLPMAVVHLRTVCFALQLRNYEVETVFNLTHADTGRFACLMSADLGCIPKFHQNGGLSPTLVRLVAHNLDDDNPIVTVSMPPEGQSADIRVWASHQNRGLTAALRKDVAEIQSHWTKCRLKIIEA